MGVAKGLTRALRRVVGKDSSVEQRLRTLRNRALFARKGVVTSIDTYVGKGRGDGRIGIYGFGGCDVWTIAAAGRRLARNVPQTVAINAFGRARFTRSDLILQTLDGVDRNAVSEVVHRLQLEPAMFQPVLFEPEFVVPDARYLGSFPKSVVVMSISSDLVRTLYRHREHGFLVDPGGFWLASGIESALQDLEQVTWFSKNFRKVGRISLDDSMANFRRLIPLVRQRTGAEVVVFNSLTVDPGRYAIDYDHSHSPHRVRRREFASALVDLARELDFSIIDVDRSIKGVGTNGMHDFVKFGAVQQKAVAETFARVLKERSFV